MEKLIIKKYRDVMDENCKTLKVAANVHERVKELADKSNRKINEIATILVEYALNNVELEEED